MDLFTRRRLLLSGGALMLSSCARRPTRFHFEWLTFATTVSVSLSAEDAEQASDAVTSLKALFNRINKDWYAWGTGELGLLNQSLLTKTTVPVSSPLAGLLERSAAMTEISQRRFDSAVGPLVKLWGFDSFDNNTPPAIAPSDSQISAALDLTRQGFRLDISESDENRYSVVTERPGSQLDVGGIAKGAALQLGLDNLKNSGISEAIIDAGGDLATLNSNRSEPYRIGIKAPRQAGLSASVSLAPGECTMSSGDYARFWTLDGKRYQHIIDPRTGWPVQNTQAVTVVSNDPSFADAAATALVVGGSGDFHALCDAMQVNSAMLVDNDGSIFMTRSFEERLI